MALQRWIPSQVLLLAAVLLLATHHVTCDPTIPVGEDTIPPTDGVNPTPEDGSNPTTGPACVSQSCMPGLCDVSASCNADYSLCVRVRHIDGTVCTDAAGYSGVCTAGVCRMNTNPVIRTRDNSILVHVPNDGDFLFDSPDLPDEISLRSIVTKLDHMVVASASFEDRHETHENTSSSLSDLLASLSTGVQVELAALAHDVGTVSDAAHLNAEAIGLGRDERSELSAALSSVAVRALANDVSVASLAADKADKTELATAVANLEAQLDSEARDIRDIQEMLADKVITITDQTDEHAGFIAGMLDTMAGHGTRLANAEDSIAVLGTTRTTVPQVSSMIKAAVDPLADTSRLDTISNAVTSLGTTLTNQVNDIKQKLEYTTWVARASAGLAGGFSVSLSELHFVGRTRCHADRKYFDTTTNTCLDCPDNNYNVVTRSCTATAIGSTELVGNRVIHNCYYGVLNGMMNDNALRYYVPAETNVWITFHSLLYLYGQSNCHGDYDSYITLYVLANGGSPNYCQHNYLRGWGVADNEYMIITCSLVRRLPQGFYTFDLLASARGVEVTLHGHYSNWDVRILGTANKDATAETATGCPGRTSQTLLQTYIQSDISLSTSACSVYYTDISSYFNTQGPWSLRSVTGRIRVHFKAMTYLYTPYCSYDGYVGLAPVINGNRPDISSLHYVRSWKANYENEHDTLVTDFVMDVTPNQYFTLTFHMYWRSANSILYSNTERSTIIVEDLPPVYPTNMPTTIPTGCKGQVRNYYVQDYLRVGSSISSSSGTSRDCAGPFTFTVQQPNTRIRFYFKVMTYQYGIQGVYGDGESYVSASFIINGGDYGWCAYNYERGWGTSKDRHKPLVCDRVYLLGQGQHTVSIRHHGAGQNSIMYAGVYRSVILIEELPTDRTRAN